jgi:oligopeptide/dipeptide ABC transporter ATP-binding protein
MTIGSRETYDGPLIEARDLKKSFGGRRSAFGRKPRTLLRAVDGVSLALGRGETMGLVGESGCGKSTLGRLMMRLIEPTEGSLYFDGQDITHFNRAAMRPLRSKFQMVFQDPMGSLDPRMRIGESIAEPLTIANRGTRRSRLEKAADMLEMVGLSADLASRFPHEFSGGQRQRICIARALIVEPDFIVADEPVSALDVSVRAQIINLLQDIQERFGLTYLFVSHDLSVVRHIADTVAVMYLGKIVEKGPAKVILKRPAHPYTRALLAATPAIRPGVVRQRANLEGDLPSPLRPPSGCRFHTRCPIAVPMCSKVEPILRNLGDDQEAACHLA